ncbi:hypothetical protein ACHAXR_003257 [Thalassiosira sp. AJA248-18]
MEQSR